MQKDALEHIPFFQMPKSWLLLDISPGAKVILCHLCDVAQSGDGSSWFSYEQMSRIVGRKKSAICGYVKELRDAGLVVTETQTTANGYNYRLRIKIVNWSNTLEGMQKHSKPNNKPEANSSSAPTKRLSERRIQQSERTDPSGLITKNQKTNTGPTAPAKIESAVPSPDLPKSVWSKEDEIEFSQCFESPGDRASDCKKLPSQRLVDRLKAEVAHLEAASGLAKRDDIKQAVTDQLSRFMAANRILSTEADADRFTDTVVSQCKSVTQVDVFFEKLQAEWHPSWRRLSNEFQIKRVFKDPAFYKIGQDLMSDSKRLILFASRLTKCELAIKQAEFWSIQKACA
jgi:hypothetical protein